MKKTLVIISLNAGLLMIAYGCVQAFWQQSVNLNPVSGDLLIPELPDPQILLREFPRPVRSLPALLPVKTPLPDYMGIDEQIWGKNQQGGDQIALLKSIDNSLRYLTSPQAIKDYQKYPIAGVTRDRVIRSLTRFRELVRTSNSAAQLWSTVQKEFVLYQSIGRDGLGNVLFTAYYEPLYDASRTPTAEYRYPLYRLPPNLKSWSKPHPTREQLEGKEGLQGDKGKLKGLELFWLRDRFDAYLTHIQGSAKLRLTDGTITSVGYAGNTAYNYSSIGKALADDGKLPLENLTMPVILKYFHENPLELDNYLPRDRSFVFFRENYGRPAVGSISVPLTADRSIATDKSIMPPGALALIHASLPYPDANQNMQFNTVSRYVLDQDAGGAIKGAGRVDYFVGTGKVAGERAGLTVSNGYLYYLLLR
jgi:membrane-bound lytic murein transglycosylase A